MGVEMFNAELAKRIAKEIRDHYRDALDDWMGRTTVEVVEDPHTHTHEVRVSIETYGDQADVATVYVITAEDCVEFENLFSTERAVVQKHTRKIIERLIDEYADFKISPHTFRSDDG